MTIQAYQTLYESSIAYGMRKALMAEQRKNDMNNSIRQLDEECDSLKKECDRLDLDCNETIKRDEEERQREQRSHEDQVATLKEKNADYKSELETLLSTPKK